MRITQPVYHRHAGDGPDDKRTPRHDLAIKERITEGSPVTVWRRTKLDGTRIIVRRLQRAGVGVLPIRITKVIDSTASSESSVTYEFFLESAWVHILPGDPAGQVYYSAHLRARYDQREQIPPYLDWMFLPGRRFRVRDYTDWMEDGEVFTAGHLTSADVAKNKYNQGSRIGKLIRSCQGSKLDTSLWLGLAEYVWTTNLSYILHVDLVGDYFLVRITRTGMWKAKVQWHEPGNALHSMIKAQIASTGGLSDSRIHPHSPEYYDLRRGEEYLFATAKNVGVWEQIGAHTDIEGSAVHGGWNGDWNGENAVHVTAQQDPAQYSYVLNGMRFRLYKATIDPTPARTVSSVQLRENVLGTPDDRQMQVFYPVPDDVFGTQVFWYFKDRHQTYGQDISSEFPVVAAYLEKDGYTGADDYFVIRYAHDERIATPGEVYNARMARAGRTCGAGAIPAFSGTTGTTNKRDGFFLDSPAGDVVNHVTEHYDGDNIYVVDIKESLTFSQNQVCLVSPSYLGAWDCTGAYFPGAWEGLGTCCEDHPFWKDSRVHSIQYGDVTQTIDFSSTRTRLLRTSLMFNAGGPTYSLVNMLYDSSENRTVTEYTDFDGPISWSGGRNGYWWSRSTICRLPPLIGGHITCGGEFDVPPADTCPAGGPTATVILDDVTDFEFEIQHHLITPKRVEMILDTSGYKWEDLDLYEDIWAMTATGGDPDPFLYFRMWAREGVEENFIGSGELTGATLTSIVTDMSFPDPSTHEGFLTIPVGGA